MLAGRDHAALLERDQELHAAGEVLAEAAAGEGMALLVQGPAGIGKTRLLEAVIEQAAGHGFDLHRARGDELEASFPYGVVRQLLEHAVRDLEPGARQRLTDGAAGLGLSLLEGQPVLRTHDGGSYQESAVAYSLYWLMQELADGCPQLLVVDDAQWADAPSLQALHFVGRRLDDLPVMVALPYRTPPPSTTEDLIARMGALPRTHRLRLQPLSEEAVDVMVRTALGHDLGADTSRAWWLATRGNPLDSPSWSAASSMPRTLTRAPPL